MQCFYHLDTPAVGICKSCQRGICQRCAVDVGKGLACRGTCEKDVGELNRLLMKSSDLGRSTEVLVRSVSVLSTTFFFLVIGLIFLGLGLYQDDRILMVLGAPFLLFGVFDVWRVWSARRSVRDDA